MLSPKTRARVAKAQDFLACIDFVRCGVVKLEPLISHRLPLDQIDQAFGLLDSGDSGRMKIILNHGN